MFAGGITCSHSFREKLVSDLLRPNKKWSLNVCISCSMLSYKIILGGTSCYMKPMPVIFLFSATCDSFYNMWNFDWSTCLVRKGANLANDYTIYVPPTFLYWLLLYIDTFKMVDNKYLPIEFFRKEWEYPAQIYCKHFPWMLIWII